MFFNYKAMQEQASKFIKATNAPGSDIFIEDEISNLISINAVKKSLESVNGVLPFINFIAPDNWLSKNISYVSVDPRQGGVNMIGDLLLSTGRAESGRFSRSMAANATPAECYEMDSSEHISWRDLAVISNATESPEVMEGVLCSYLTSKIYMDDLRIAFNGRSAAPFTNPEDNPNGEDVAPGWHEVARKASGGKQIISDKVTVGTGGEFSCVDALVQHLINEKIAAPYRNDPRLVVMVGGDIVAHERLRLFSAGSGASDTVAASAWGSTIAGRFAFVPPFMPGKRIVVTTLANLLVYILAGSYRTEFTLDDVGKRLHMQAWRHQGYGLADAGLYAAVDESALTLVS
ncbi:P2 family phage major capsid protein [Escherichia coli]|uniref:P2 family phage major capsid protein n=1 Tax=Escherichia coli TaxID=562 RepID=UPI0030F3ED13